VDIYDSEYRRQYCQERVAQIREDYSRAQAQPEDSPRRIRVVAQMRSIVQRVRQQAPQSEPAYRS
jgi:hypothetical protein